MKQLLQELRVSNADTHIVDSNNKQITTKQIGKGYWLLGFDRDGTCFEMCSVSRQNAKDSITDFGTYSLSDLEITDYAGARYYWNENAHDTGLLRVA